MQAIRQVAQKSGAAGSLVRRARYPVPCAARSFQDERGGGRRSKRHGGGRPGNNSAKYRAEESKLFSPENVEGISPVELARMKVAYGLVREHAEAVEKGGAALDPESNPLIDPRSFDIKTLPRLPKETLHSFRKELPAKAARTARPVPTYAVWEEQGPDGLGPDLVSATGNDEWAAVDERTMDASTFAKMRRQSINVADAPPPFVAPSRPTAASRGKRRCVLSDARGRVDIDFRSVGKLVEFVSDGGKIQGRKKTGLTAKAQRKMSRAVKCARTMALIAPDPPAGLTLKEMQEMESELK